MCICTHKYMYIHICIYIYVCIHIYMYIFIYIYIYVYVYIIYICTCMYTFVPFLTSHIKPMHCHKSPMFCNVRRTCAMRFTWSAKKRQHSIKRVLCIFSAIPAVHHGRERWINFQYFSHKWYKPRGAGKVNEHRAVLFLFFHHLVATFGNEELNHTSLIIFALRIFVLRVHVCTDTQACKRIHLCIVFCHTICSCSETEYAQDEMFRAETCQIAPIHQHTQLHRHPHTRVCIGVVHRHVVTWASMCTGRLPSFVLICNCSPSKSMSNLHVFKRPSLAAAAWCSGALLPYTTLTICLSRSIVKRCSTASKFPCTHGWCTCMLSQNAQCAASQQYTQSPSSMAHLARLRVERRHWPVAEISFENISLRLYDWVVEKPLQRLLLLAVQISTRLNRSIAATAASATTAPSASISRAWTRAAVAHFWPWFPTFELAVGTSRFVAIISRRTPPKDWFWLRGWLINKGAICARTAPFFEFSSPSSRTQEQD